MSNQQIPCIDCVCIAMCKSLTTSPHLFEVMTGLARCSKYVEYILKIDRESDTRYHVNMAKSSQIIKYLRNYE